MQIRAQIALVLLLVTLVLLGVVAVSTVNLPDERLADDRAQVLTLFALIALVVPVASYVLTRRIVKPLTDLAETVSRIEGGNLDISVPYTGGHDEIAGLANSISAMVERLQAHDALNSEKIQGLNAELEAARRELKQLATRDSLTGLINDRVFFETLEMELKRVSRSGHPVSVLLLEIDDLKRINNAHGGEAGTGVLRHAGELLMGNLRITDCAARYGNEAIAILLPETNGANAYKLAEKLRKLIMIETFDVGTQQLEVTASIGLAATDVEVADSADDLMRRADQALDRAKAGGRNRVETA